MKDIVGVFDDENGSDETSRVKYNEGGSENDGKGKVRDAVVTHVVDEDNLVLAAWVGGTFQLLNDGKPVPRRSEADYGPEGGGVTWDK